MSEGNAPEDMFRPLRQDEIASAPMPTDPPAEEWASITPVPDDVKGEFPHHRLGKPSAWWVYRNAEKQRLFIVCRFDLPDGGKDILPVTYCQHTDGRREWRWKGLPTPRPLYRLDQIAGRHNAPVLICEGEKSADAAGKLFPDYVTTTSPNGAKSADKADWSPLARRVVTIWPDHDDEGRAYAADVTRLALAAGAALVAVVTMPDDFPEKWDLADEPPAGWDADKLRDLLIAAKPTELPDEEQGDKTPDPDLSIINECRRPAPELPLEVFGPWQKWITATGEGTASPPDYAACALLVVAAAIIGNSRWVRPWESWESAPCLWLALIGSPSSGKSPALVPLIKILREIELDLAGDYDETLRQWRGETQAAKCVTEIWENAVKAAVKEGHPPPDQPAGAVAPEKPARPRLLVNDTTPEEIAAIMAGQPRGILAYRDELSGWLGGFDRYGRGGGERAFWLEAFNGSPFTVDRVKFDQPLTIAHNSVSVLGGIQPDRLSGLMLSGEDDGLVARFLMTWPDPIPPRRPKVVPNNAHAEEALRRLLGLGMGSGTEGRQEPVILSLTADAADLFDDWRQEHTATTADAMGMLAGHYGKLPGVVLRLGLVLEHLWWALSPDPIPPSAVSIKAMKGAIVLLSDYFMPMAERAYGDASLPETDRLGAVLARWVVKTRPRVVNASNLRRNIRLPGLTDPSKVKSALDTLIETGWLIAPASSSGPGRRKSDYAVNPKLWEVLS